MCEIVIVLQAELSESNILSILSLTSILDIKVNKAHLVIGTMVSPIWPV